VYKLRNNREFKEKFDAEEFEMLIYIILKYTKSIDTVFAHSLAPVFVVEAMKKFLGD